MAHSLTLKKRIAVLVSALTFSASVHAQTALTPIEQAAEKGDADAQVVLGRMYYDGIGIPVDRKKAFEWNQKAADQGRPEAMLLLASAYNDTDYQTSYVLGMQYVSGDIKNRKWHDLMVLARAKALDRAAQGDPAAMYVVAKVSGLSSFQDPLQSYYKQDQTSRQLIQQSAEKGYIPAEIEMIGIENAWLHPRDLRAQLPWAQKAAKAGSSRGMFSLGILYRNMHDDEKAKMWLLRSAELNNTDAISTICYSYGIRVGNYPESTYKGCNGRPTEVQIDPVIELGFAVFGGAILLGLLGPRDQRTSAERSADWVADTTRWQDCLSAHLFDGNGYVCGPAPLAPLK